MENTHITLKYSKFLTDGEKAVFMRFPRKQAYWFPKKVCLVDEAEKTIKIETWFFKQEFPFGIMDDTMETIKS